MKIAFILGLMDLRILYPDLKSKTNKPKSNSKRMQKTKNSVQNVKAQGVASVNSKNSATNSVVSPRVSKKHLNEFILSDQGKIFQVGAKLGEITKYSANKYIFKIEDKKAKCSGKILLRNKFFLEMFKEEMINLIF